MAPFNFGSQMKPLGQMWAQPQQQQGAPTGQLPTMGAPQMGQGAPTGQFPLNPQGGQQMTPGGGSTGAPLQMGQMPMQGQNPGYQMGGMLPSMQQDYRQQRQDYMATRPDHQGFTGNGQDWHAQMQAFRAGMPQRPQFMRPLGR